MRQSRFSGNVLGMTSNSSPNFFKISTRRGDCDAKTTRRPANFERTSNNIQRSKGITRFLSRLDFMEHRAFEPVASLRALYEKGGRLQVRLKSGRGVLLILHNGSVHALDHACYRECAVFGARFVCLFIVSL